VGKEEHTARASLLRLKPDGGCLSNACVRATVCSVYACVKERETGGGIKPWGSLSRCQGGAGEEEREC